MLSPIFQHFGVLECLASEAVWRLYGYKFAPNFGGSVAVVGSHYRHTTAKGAVICPPPIKYLR